MTASAILSAIAPQFDADSNRSTHLQLATKRTNSTCFGENYNYAVALRAAHTLTLYQRAQSTGGAAGSVTDKREGDLSISFSAGGDSDLDLTSYGKELKGLIKGNIVATDVCGLKNIICPEE